MTLYCNAELTRGLLYFDARWQDTTPGSLGTLSEVTITKANLTEKNYDFDPRKNTYYLLYFQMKDRCQ